MLLSRDKAPVGTSPYGTGSDGMDTYSANRDVQHNLGIAYVP
jgi:hypothetical protein